MSQNTFQHEPSRTGITLPSRRELIAPITSAVREQRPLDTDLPAVVLTAVADRLSWLSTPDVLALRAQLTVDVDDQLPLADRVGTIVDAILAEIEQWKRGASR
jgi:hypothetical protein